MSLIDKNDSVLLKLLYYCATHKEVFFKRSSVSDFLIKDKNYTIPNKPGFDGNITFFGYDIRYSEDLKERILLLRGKIINELCITGNIKFKIGKENTEITVNQNFEDFKTEYNFIKHNKSIESKSFSIRKRILEENGILETDLRLTRNQKVYKKGEKYYFFPKLVLNPIKKEYYYEIINSENFINYIPLHFIFPAFNIDLSSDNWLIYSKETIEVTYEELFDKNYLGLSNNYFCYFILKNKDLYPINVEEEITNKIETLKENNQYDLSDKETTSQVMANVRLNQNKLRINCLERDNHKCILCDLNLDDLLICSHILPWKENIGRLDINNVLTLCDLHNALFDKGYISFDNTGKIIISKKIKQSRIISTLFKNSNNNIYNVINKKMKKYLNYHSDNIFKK